MSFLGDLAKIGSVFVPGAGGAALGAVGSMMDGRGNDGRAEINEANERRKKALDRLYASGDRMDKTVQGMDLSPDRALERFRESASFYNDIAQKNSVTNSMLGRLMRSSEPGVQLANQNAEARLKFAEGEDAIRAAADQRRLSAEGQLADVQSRVSQTELGQADAMSRLGFAQQQASDAQYGQGMDAIIRQFSTPEMTDWVSGRLGIKKKPTGATAGAVKTLASMPKLQTKIGGQYGAGAPGYIGKPVVGGRLRI